VKLAQAFGTMTSIGINMSPGVAIVDLWIAFAVTWLVAALWADRTEKSAGASAEAPYRITLMAGAALLLVPAHGYHGWMRLWQVNSAEAWACVALMVVGLALAWWARFHLGRLWSGKITKKTEHRIVDTGPYALVRHPIYTGLLLAILATMIAKGTLPGIAGAVLAATGIYMKARLEERFLRAELGADAYDAYSRRVPMLIPFT
jgi:protein-S-isoprenylcysteine O-methyltransferase Ste14